jgi:hypothetical protein
LGADTSHFPNATCADVGRRLASQLGQLAHQLRLSFVLFELAHDTFVSLRPDALHSRSETLVLQALAVLFGSAPRQIPE